MMYVSLYFLRTQTITKSVISLSIPNRGKEYPSFLIKDLQPFVALLFFRCKLSERLNRIFLIEISYKGN